MVGGSGAGKSTLVNALCGFKPATEGAVLLNGVDLYDNFDAYRNEMGYVPQDDIIHLDLPVSKALDYAARLRMPADTSRYEREQRVREVIDELDLKACADRTVRQLSGGQRKRVSIGVELLTRPSLFFLDEATSGLDPATESADDEAPAQARRPGTHDHPHHARHQERHGVRQGRLPGARRPSGLLRAAGGRAQVLRRRGVRRDLRAPGVRRHARGVGAALPGLAAAPGVRGATAERGGRRAVGRLRRRPEAARRPARSPAARAPGAGSGTVVLEPVPHPLGALPRHHPARQEDADPAAAPSRPCWGCWTSSRPSATCSTRCTGAPPRS